MAESAATYWAHSENDAGAGIRETLAEHLRQVARLAREFAEAFDAGPQAEAAGLLHDLGKYGESFQRRLDDPSVRAGDHWTAGALAALRFLKEAGIAPALAILGHHGGLPAGMPHRSADRLAQAVGRGFMKDECLATSKDLPGLFARWQKDGLALPEASPVIAAHEYDRLKNAATMLDVRMLFSSLVDADFLATEAHFSGDAETPRRPRPSGLPLDCDRAIEALEAYRLAVKATHASHPMAELREQLYENCVDAASFDPGVFTLSAPTGSGKTLAMLAFALHHARRHGMRRIVLVVPYINIIDQTARVYRDIFSHLPPGAVLEHHSLNEDILGARSEEPEEPSDTNDGPSPRLLAENWDAPVILTTTVQFFESLMSHRPSRCRKLHRLAKSVVLFDEVQSLPIELAVATLATIARLADPDGPFRSSIVFATATQPAFETLDEPVRQFCYRGWKPREIVQDVPNLFRAAKNRVNVEWRHETRIDWDELAAEIAVHRRVLAIVNLKRHAIELVDRLKGTLETEDGLLHLSTSMCPAHRSRTLDEVRRRLDSDERLVLVSTQCVEAGVDLDFPIVYRALAPLEAIAQAAGRCNRHGLLARPGKVVVFKPDDEYLYPPGYAQAAGSAEAFLNGRLREGGSGNIIDDPHELQNYFAQYYHLCGYASAEEQSETEILRAVAALDYPETDRLYRLIRQDAINVLVPYDRDEFHRLLNMLEQCRRLTPEFLRRWRVVARPYVVSIFRPRDGSPIWNRLEPLPFRRNPPLETWEATWFRLLDDDGYDELIGWRPNIDDTLLSI
ncbi:CRISPR-associated helicase/endonuclease Cas3 [Thermostilla marina]